MSLEIIKKHILENQETFIARLAEAVAIPSVSSTVEHRGYVHDMSIWLRAQLDKLDCYTELHYPGPQELEGNTLQLPPIVIAQYPRVPVKGKKTVLVYGHADVQPAILSDGWTYDPFVLTRVPNGDDEILFGRGSTDDKGPVLGWLNVIESFRATGQEFPVNLKMIFEGMEESGSEGLDDLVKILDSSKPEICTAIDAKPTPAHINLHNVEYVCISDNYWLSTTHPCVTYGLRGICTYSLVVSGPQKDLHSGVFGGMIYEPMTDLVKVMGKLLDVQGNIQIPGIYDLVAPISPEEEELYKTLHFSMSDIHDATGSKTTVHESASEALQHRWRLPSLSLHGIEGAFASPGFKTVIPAKVIGKFSIRIVPDMEPKDVNDKVKAYVDKVFKELNSANTCVLKCGEGAKAWVGNPNDANFTAAKRATELIWGVTPDFTREGGSIPVTLTFSHLKSTSSVLLLPMGKSDDGAHSINEKLDKKNYIRGCMTLAAYLLEISKA